MKFALVGKQLIHSYSLRIHALQGLDYSLCEVQPNNLASMVNTREFNGYNVTIPYKTDIIRYLDGVSNEALEIGSVNTVNTENGKLIGHNTDIKGLEYLFGRKGVNLSGKCVTVLGSGGTSKTATYLCKKSGVKKISVVSRSGEINYENCYEKLGDTEIIINTTPVGMFPNIFESVIDLSKFSKLEFVADCIYNPLKTDLILQAEKLNIKCSNGLPMLVKQAIESEKIWLNDVQDNTEDILARLVREKSNVVLYGMPSCGKSSIGKLLAKKIDKEFFDTDLLIEKEYGKSPKQIIENSGEKQFREYERKIIKNIATVNNAVISLGGGSVLDLNNVNDLRKNGILVYVDRDIDKLDVTNRPLSAKLGVKRLYEERKKIYQNIYDIKVDNNSDINLCVERIIKEYENTCNKRC